MFNALASQWLARDDFFVVPREIEFSDSPLKEVRLALSKRSTCSDMLKALWAKASTDTQRQVICALFHRACLQTIGHDELTLERRWLASQVNACSIEVRFVWEGFFPTSVYASEDSDHADVDVDVDEKLDRFDGYDYQATHWIEYGRSAFAGHEPFDWTGAWYFVDDALGTLSTTPRMLEALWNHAETRLDYERILGQFHDSTSHSFHPCVVERERTWISKQLETMDQDLRDYWAELSADLPTEEYWEEWARKQAAELQGDIENRILLQENLPLWGIDPNRISEIWPENTND